MALPQVVVQLLVCQELEQSLHKGATSTPYEAGYTTTQLASLQMWTSHSLEVLITQALHSVSCENPLGCGLNQPNLHYVTSVIGYSKPHTVLGKSCTPPGFNNRVLRLPAIVSWNTTFRPGNSIAVRRRTLLLNVKPARMPVKTPGLHTELLRNSKFHNLLIFRRSTISSKGQPAKTSCSVVKKKKINSNQVGTTNGPNIESTRREHKFYKKRGGAYSLKKFIIILS